jgi:superfamily II DNA or RNA helicase
MDTVIQPPDESSDGIESENPQSKIPETDSQISNIEFIEVDSDGENQLDHYAADTLSFLRRYLHQSADILRVATGYFSIEGFDSLRLYLLCREVRVLIGYDQNAPAVLHNQLIDRIMEDLRRWNGEERREAVKQIADSMELGKFKILKKDSVDELYVKSRQKDHAKIYILDSRLVLPGSANLTKAGLRFNSENSNAITDPQRVSYYLQKFNTNWFAPDAYDVTQDLFEALSRWLKMVLPYDIYLKTIDALSPRTKLKPPLPSYKMPSIYQEEVVQRMLRQIEQYRGSILIASTGLGKTIMATHTALELYNRGLIKSVLVFAPVATHADWSETLGSSRLHAKVFTRNLLDSPPKENSHKLFEVMKALEEVDEFTYIVIDEAQYFVNKNRKPRKINKSYIIGERESFKRIHDAVQVRGALITLMTATPFVKRASDVNNQLELMPHTGTPFLQNRRGQLKLIFDLEDASHAWHVLEDETYFEQFAKLPISTIITTAYVAKHYCISTPEGEYLDFPDGKKYLPRVSQYRMNIPLFLEEEIASVFENGYLQHQEFHFRDRDMKRQRSRWTIEKQATISSMSSPLALRRVIEQAIEGQWDKKIPFTYPLEVRKAKLTPLLNKIRKINWRNDIKFLTLVGILDDSISQSRKIIVFVEILSTAIYLQEQLKKARPDLSVACSVKYDKQKDEYKTKSKSEVHQIILDFASEANAKIRVKSHPVKHYDVFITTNAYGVGVNLEDASVVVNYDLSWTPDVIIQRAGRVLRFWREPRKVLVYTFTHILSQENMSIAAKQVQKRTKELYQRAKDATRFTELPLLTDKDSIEHETLAELSHVIMEDLGVLSPDNIEHVSHVSPMLHRLTERREHLQRADNIPDDVVSALETHRLNSPYLYMLLKYEARYHLVIYDIAKKLLVKMGEDEILDLIHCAPDTPTATVDLNEVEKHASKCVILWCSEKKIDPESVERICTLYILPKSHQIEFKRKDVKI